MAAVVGSEVVGSGFARARRPVVERVVVINDDGVANGGAAAIAIASALSLRERGLQVCFLGAGTAFDPRLNAAGVAVHSLGGAQLMESPRPKAAIRGLFDPATARALSAWLGANDTPGTCYHLHNWHKALSPSVFRPLSRVRARLVMTAHDYFLACPNGGYVHYPRERTCELTPGSLGCAVANCDRRHYAHKLWRLARHKLRQHLFDLAQAPARVIAVHEGMVPLLERGGIPRPTVRVLRNPVAPRRSDRVRVEHNRHVMFVGRLEEDKGVCLLAAAARTAGLPLILVGSGPLAESLREQYPEVTFLGWQSPERIGELLGSARLLAAPSRWRETFGLVALEALMCGVPVMVSRFAMIAPEIVESGFGLACDPHDIDAMAETMRRLAEDDDRLRSMSLRAFAEARRLAPTQDEWCENLMNLYCELLDGRPAGQSVAGLLGASVSLTPEDRRHTGLAALHHRNV